MPPICVLPCYSFSLPLKVLPICISSNVLIRSCFFTSHSGLHFFIGVCVCVCVFCFWLCLATVCLHHLSLNFPSCIRLGRCFRACCNAYPTLYLGPKFHMHVYVHCRCVTCIMCVHSGSYIWVYRLCKQSIRRDELKWE